MRREMRRVNTTQPSFPGDELIAQVVASHSNDLPIVQAIVGANMLIPTADLWYNPSVIRFTLARKLDPPRLGALIVVGNFVVCSLRTSANGGRLDLPLEPVGSN